MAQKECDYCYGGKIQIYTQNGTDWLDSNDWGLVVSLREREILKSAEDWTNFFRDIEVAINGTGEISCPACKR